ncbi:MAG: methionine gamma-lyase family protein [Clostridia bacterium]|nr:methionine gamma-lyase family protein [Clostridia bacterium]MBQ9749051.1 methionine gamma-lyase family protein [Clostridia bacterium]
MEFNKMITDIVSEAEEKLAKKFAEFDSVAFKNTERVLDAFRRHKVSDSMFAGTTGYGYNDKGRDTLDLIYADVFGAEAALVRHNIVNGTQTIAIGLYALLRPGDVMLSVTGKPYDTLEKVIGINPDATVCKTGEGSLADFGVEYDQVDLLDDGGVDFASIKQKLEHHGERVKVVFIQRSKGYMTRPTLSVKAIGDIVKFTKAISDAYVVVDNCYGEFCEELEPCAVGADMILGSLIKNAGGGIALSGGYIAGTKKAVELASYRHTTVGTGNEVGASLGQNRDMFRGFFLAPHTVAQALKTAALAAYVFEKLGYVTEPSWNDDRYDIIQRIQCASGDKLCAFCRGIQYASPVDSFATPEPWEMPGYTDPVIMAAGAFVQGSSIELSADGPMRPPFTAYLQGGLTYEAGKIGIMSAASEMLKD